MNIVSKLFFGVTIWTVLMFNQIPKSIALEGSFCFSLIPFLFPSSFYSPSSSLSFFTSFFPSIQKKQIFFLSLSLPLSFLFSLSSSLPAEETKASQGSSFVSNLLAEIESLPTVSRKLLLCILVYLYLSWLLLWAFYVQVFILSPDTSIFWLRGICFD